MKRYFIIFLFLLCGEGLFAETSDLKWIARGVGASLKYEQENWYLNGDFSKGGPNVSMQSNLPDKIKFKALRFQLRSPYRRVAVRFFDGAKQVHQHYLKTRGNPNIWETIEFPVAGSPAHCWGGAGDGVLRDGVHAVAIVFHRTDLGRSQSGEAIIRNIEFLPEPSTPKKRINRLKSWRVSDPVRHFREVGDEAPLEFLLDFLPDKKIKTVAFTWYDYQGSSVKTGHVDCQKDKLLVPVPSGKGFFELKIPELGVEAGFFVDSAPPAEADEYFAIDSSFSWGAPPADSVMIGKYLEIMKNNGVIWNRDRLKWGAIEKTRGRADFNNRFGLYRRTAAAKHIKTLDVVHDAPSWTGAKLRTKKNDRIYDIYYPSNLYDYAQSFIRINREFEATQKAFEVWNEPDIGFGNTFPPPYAVSLLKAFSRGAADAKLELQVGGGAFATVSGGIHPYEFLNFDTYKNYILNGLLDDADFVSHHFYRSVKDVERPFTQLRKLEKQYGGKRAGIPHWVTECGKPRLFNGNRRGELNSDLDSAAEIAGKAAEFRALGVAKYFVFEYKFRRENKWNFSQMDDHHTPMRSLAAYFHTVRVLSHREYAGDLKNIKAVRARVFKNDRNAVAVIYNGTQKDALHSVPLPPGLKVLKAEGLDGRSLAIDHGKVPNDDGICFVYFPLEQVGRFVDTDTSAMKLYRMARDYRPPPRAAKPLVLQLDKAPKGFFNATEFQFFPATRQAAWTIRIWNFSEKMMEFVPEWKLPKGFRITKKPVNMMIAPHASAVTELAVDFPPSQPEEERVIICVGDRNGNATPLVLPLAFLNPEKLTVTANKTNRWTHLTQWRTWDEKTLESDIQAKFRIFIEKGDLRIQILVTDSEHCNNWTNAEAWYGDSVQIALEQRNADGTSKVLSDKLRGVRHHEFTAALGRNSKIILYRNLPAEGKLKKSTVSIQKQNRGKLLYDLKLDPEEFGISLKPGSKIGVSLLVNSAGLTAGRRGFLTWGGGIGDEDKLNTRFNLLEIAPSKGNNITENR